MHTAAKLVFWLCAGTMLYVYAGYPVLLALLARLAPRRGKSTEGSLPKVTLLVSAFNENAIIAEKVKNSLALDYPPNLLEILVISDCSDDGTDESVAKFSPQGVRLIRQPERRGKSAGLNLGTAQATGQILVFSDANALYHPDAVRQLVRHFSDPQVGYVVGNARYLEESSASAPAKSEGLYWKLETWLKKDESLFFSVVGGDGAIYAIRRELYAALLPTDINDFLNPLQIIARGYVGVFEPAAISYEHAAGSFASEYRRKVRIVSRSANALRRIPSVLIPFGALRHWFMLVSHKLLRWLAPVFLILLGLATALLHQSAFYRIAGMLQLAFYGLALIGWGLQRHGTSWKLFYLPYYFCLVNLASLLGLFNCFRGTLSPTWKPARQSRAVKEGQGIV